MFSERIIRIPEGSASRSTFSFSRYPRSFSLFLHRPVSRSRGTDSIVFFLQLPQPAEKLPGTLIAFLCNALFHVPRSIMRMSRLRLRKIQVLRNFVPFRAVVSK